MARVEDALRLAQRSEQGLQAGQMGLFGASVARPAVSPARPAPAAWDPKERLRYEKEALGFYVTGHPLDKYERELRRLKHLSTAELATVPDGSVVTLAGVIQGVKLRNNKSGKRYAVCTLEDREGTVEAIAWPETYRRYEALLHGDEPVVARGKLDLDEERAQVILDELRALNTALVEAVREVHISACRRQIETTTLERLREAMQQSSGRALVYLHVGLDNGSEAVFLVGGSLRVAPTEEFVTRVEEVIAPGAVSLH
jgi:DNA polymerase-3 subunit alpha